MRIVGPKRRVVGELDWCLRVAKIKLQRKTLRNYGEGFSAPLGDRSDDASLNVVRLRSANAQRAFAIILSRSTRPSHSRCDQRLQATPRARRPPPGR